MIRQRTRVTGGSRREKQKEQPTFQHKAVAPRIIFQEAHPRSCFLTFLHPGYGFFSQQVLGAVSLAPMDGHTVGNLKELVEGLDSVQVKGPLHPEGLVGIVEDHVEAEGLRAKGYS